MSFSKGEDLNPDDLHPFFSPVMRRGNRYFDFRWDNAYFHYSSHSIRTSEINPDDLLRDNILILLNGQIYNCPAGISEFNFLRDLYKKHDENMFSRLDGKFIALVYDLDKKRFIVGRDYFGKVPLFYLRKKNRLFFSSLISPLVPIRGDDGEKSLDSVYLAEYEVFKYNSFNNTLYDGIEQLPPGNCILCDGNGEIGVKGYPAPADTAEESVELTGYKSDYEKLYALLKKSITRRIKNNYRQEIGILVSGIDSYILLKILEEICPYKVYAFTFYGDRAPFEYDYNPRKTEVFEHKVSVEDIFAVKEECSLLFEGERHHPFYIYLFAKVVKSLKPDLKVLFCGEGADELFGGYTQWIRSFKEKEEDPLLSDGIPGSMLYNDYKAVLNNIKDICNFYLKHQLVARHLNPFNVAFQNFLMEVRCPFLDWDIYRLMQLLPEKEFEDKKIIKDLAYHCCDFDGSDYKKYGLPQLFSKKLAFKRKYVNVQKAV